MVWPFLLLTLATGTTIGVLAFSNARDAVDAVSGQMRAEMAGRIQGHLEAFFSVPQALNRLNAAALADGSVDAHSAPALMQRFRHQIQSFKGVTSLYFGNAAGGLALAGREGADGALYHIDTAGFVAGPFVKVRTDEAGRERQQVFARPDFDARSRPWYRAAVQAGGPTWSDIYVLFTGDGMAIAPSRPVYTPSGELMGVVAADLFLTHISDFLRSLHRDRPGQTVILDPSGLLVASSTGAPVVRSHADGAPARRLPAWESDDPVIRQIGRSLRDRLPELAKLSTGRHETITVAGKPHLLELSTFSDPHGLSLLIAIATPKSAYFGPIAAGNRQTLGLVLLALLGTCLLGLLIAHRIADPLLRLNQSAQTIAAGDYGHRIQLDRRDELGHLAHSFNRMAETLQTAFGQLEQQLETLSAREEALRTSEERFSLAMQGANDGLWDWNLTTGTVYYSPRWKSMLGYADAELGDTPEEWDSRLHPDDRARSRARIANCLDGREPRYDCEYRLRHKDGRYRWMLSRGFVVTGLEGWPVRLVGTHVDISDWKAAQAEILALTERISLATEAAQIGIWDLHLPSNRLHWDPVMYRLFGVAPEVFAGTYEAWQKLVHPDDLPAVLAGAEAAMRSQRERHRTGFRVIRPDDGNVRHMEAHIALAYDAQGHPIRMLGVNFDVTAIKAAEAALTQEKERAEQANSAKSRFLATMSHELRTPLNAVIGFAELLHSQETRRERREQLQMIGEAGRSLLTLIGDILDLSRIEAGRTEIRPTESDLKAELKRVVALFSRQAHKRGTTLSLALAPNLPERLRLDFDLLRQVLVNLLGNAVKFTEGGRISLSASLVAGTETTPAELLFQVADTGIGIAARHLDRIFEAFEQVHETMIREFGGSGLGLSISRKLVALLGGRIWVDSEPGVGSTFSFTVNFEPVAAVPAPVAESPSALSAPATKDVQVLVVEDERCNRLLLEALVKEAGYRVESVADGPAALAWLDSNATDLVLMDIQLPHLSGLDVVRRIRAGAVAHCPPDQLIVAVTAFAIEGDRERFLAEGLDGYISKPVDRRQLIGLIETLLVKQSDARSAESSAPACAAARA